MKGGKSWGFYAVDCDVYFFVFDESTEDCHRRRLDYDLYNRISRVSWEFLLVVHRCGHRGGGFILVA